MKTTTTTPTFFTVILTGLNATRPITTMGCTASKPKFENIDQRVVELVRYTRGGKVRPYTLRTAVSRRGYRISQNPLRGYF